MTHITKIINTYTYNMINYMKIWNRSRIHQGRVVGHGEEIQSPARKASL